MNLLLNESLIFNFFVLLFTGSSMSFDVTQRRIPNWLNLAGIGGGMVLNLWKGAPQFFDSLLGCGAGVGILLIPFAFGWLGAGDVKFFGAVGAIFGLSWIPRLFFYSSVLGLASALISCAATRGIVKQLFKGTLTIPYGVSIGLGALIAFYLDSQGKWAGF
ncbi:MAG TPA: prepilin peptidase [Candidatus Binatia bacterium]|jgi:prepilin peptidase CpaA